MSRFRLTSEGAVRINEETLRDGEQTPHVIFLPEGMDTIATALARVLPGSIINAGYPAISPAEAEAVRAVVLAVRDADVECAGRAAREEPGFPGEKIVTDRRTGRMGPCSHWSSGRHCCRAYHHSPIYPASSCGSWHE